MRSHNFSFVLPAYFLLIFFWSFLPANDVVVRLKPGFDNLKNEIKGRPLFNISGVEKNSGDILFFNSFRIYAVEEELPPPEWIISIDTLKNLKIDSRPFTSPIKGIAQNIDYSTVRKSDAKIKIGIIDTGIDFFHVDIVDHLFINTQEDINGNGRLDLEDLNGIDEDGNGYIDDVSGFDFVNVPEDPDFGDYLDPDPWPYDEYPGGHGTAVAHASIISSYGQASIVNLRAGTASGFLQEDDIAQAVFYAYRNNIQILNMSFGDSRITNFLADLVEYVSDKGILVVASAGNSHSTSPHYPSSFASAISVGAVNSDNFRAGFSNYGFYVDIYAFGQDLNLAKPGGGRSDFSGTSFSAPLVSGGLAKMWGENNNLTNFEIKTWILLNVIDPGDPGWDFDYSNGIFEPTEQEIAAVKTRFRFIKPHASGLFADSSLVIIENEGLGSGMSHLYYGYGSKPSSWQLLKSNLDFGIDSTWFSEIGENSLVLLKLEWNEDNSGRGIQQYQRITRVEGPPSIRNWEIIPQIESAQQAYLIKALIDQPAHLELINSNLSSLSSTIDTVGYLPVYPRIETEYTGNELYAVNEAGRSVPANIPDLYFNSILTGYFIEEEVQLNEGNAYIWSEEFSGLYAASLFNIAGTLDPLGIYNLATGIQVYGFDEPWIIRDMIQLGNNEYRFLLGYGRNSKIVDFSVSENKVLRNWEFSGEWAVRFYKDKAVFREDPNFNLYELVSGNWSKEFTFNKHTQAAYFSVPGAAVIDSLIIFADMEGRVFIYEEISNNVFTYTQNFSLSGWDPGNLLTSWKIDLDGVVRNSFWAVSEIRPDKITESNVDGNYWQLEGFIINSDTTYKISELNFRGVAPRDKRWPGLGNITISDKSYLVVNLYPETYFLGYSDSIRVHHAHAEGPFWYNYHIKSTTGSYLSNSDNGSLIKIELRGDDLILPEPNNIRWIFQDSSNLLLGWNGLDSAEFYISENITGLKDTIAVPKYIFAMNQIPFSGGFQIKQKKNGILSDWSNEINIDISSFPKLVEGSYYENDFIVLEFENPIIYDRNSSIIKVDPGSLRSVNLAAPNKLLLKVIDSETDTVHLEINNLYSEEWGAYTENDLVLIKEKALWQPSLISSNWDGNVLNLVFEGIFADSVLLNISNYTLTPSGKIERISKSGTNLIALHVGRLAPLGYDYKLSFPQIIDINGQQLRHTELLITAPAVNDFDKVVLYPQPLKFKQHKTLIIAGLPLDAQVTIYSADRRLIHEISANVQNGKLEWNLKNDFGETVASGIYLILINRGNEKILKKALILR